MKVGIITMHRVLNFGSILQAYALQEVLRKLDVESEIIDYCFPPKDDKSLYARLNVKLRKFIYDVRTLEIFKKSKESYFRSFSKKYLKLSSQELTRDTIYEIKHVYDVVVTGSDQVWNPRWTKEDTTFLLDFVDDETPKISYASSFACDSIPEKLIETYTKSLSRYKALSVREKLGARIVSDLLGNKAEVVCDPTLLLSSQDYQALSVNSKIHVKGKYILVYILSYMFDPYPEVNNIISSIKDILKLQVVYIGGRYSRIDRNCAYFENIGPCEFIWLFEHAEFVITTSFHGVAFSTIFSKPLLAVTQGKNSGDDRISSLLNQVNNKDAIISYLDDVKFSAEELYELRCQNNEREEYRMVSKNWLQKQLS